MYANGKPTGVARTACRYQSGPPNFSRMGHMRHIRIVMVRCPTTGRELSTGIQMDATTFEKLPDIRSQIRCPICKVDHVWSTRDAWLDNPHPSIPGFAW